jgi:uncharacterized membrane protein
MTTTQPELQNRPNRLPFPFQLWLSANGMTWVPLAVAELNFGVISEQTTPFIGVSPLTVFYSAVLGSLLGLGIITGLFLFVSMSKNPQRVRFLWMIIASLSTIWFILALISPYTREIYSRTLPAAVFLFFLIVGFLTWRNSRLKIGEPIQNIK